MKGFTYDSVELGQGLWVILHVQQRLDLPGVDFHAGSLLELTERVDRRDPPEEFFHGDHIILPE